jgi:hypothetical protein
MLSRWCYSGATDVTVVLQWCYSGIIVVLQWCYSGFTVALQWCYSDNGNHSGADGNGHDDNDGVTDLEF